MCTVKVVLKWILNHFIFYFAFHYIQFAFTVSILFKYYFYNNTFYKYAIALTPDIKSWRREIK